MTTLRLSLAEIPPCVRESLRVCLKAHDIELPEELLVEASRNIAQGLCSIDETPPDAAPLTFRTHCIGCGKMMPVGASARLYEEGWVHAEGCPS